MVVALLAIGGCAMYLSWGAWGVFVTCSALTLTAASVPVIALFTRSVAAVFIAAAGPLILSLWLMHIGWGLVAPLYPEYVMSWHLPMKNGPGITVRDAADAREMAMEMLSLGGLLTVVTLAGIAFGMRNVLEKD